MKFFYLFAGLLLGVTATSASPAAELNANLLSARDGTYEGVGDLDNNTMSKI